MKAGVLVIAAAAIASGVSAKKHHNHRRHNHEEFHMERGLLLTTGSPEPTCGCTTIYTTITGEGTLYNPPPPPTTTTPTAIKTSAPASTSPATVPTPFVTTCPTPGVYTIPATTITITEETTVCAATSTAATSGTNTAGGVTTVVETSTTVVCPYAAETTSAGVVVTTILTTTYVCPTAGTYTIAPLTTVCEIETIWVYPTVTSYPPGTYTQNEVIETVTETDYVIFCPYTSSAPALPAPTSPAPPSSSAPASGGTLGTSGKKWAITYSPYQNNGLCKDAGTVASDIAAIAAAGYTSVRVYSTDCSSLENIGSACATYGLKMIIGIFINESGCSGAAEQVTDITSWAKWELVELIVIGNEAIFGGYTTASELAAFIVSSKSAFSSAGYSGPCTTTEPLNIWQESTEILCEVVDVVGCNIHAYFNGDVEPSGAGAFVAGQLDLVDALCPGKYGINLETGWPSSGNCIGISCPGAEAQLAALDSLAEAVGGKSVVLSFFDDMWKNPGSCACEQYFGIVQIVSEF